MPERIEKDFKDLDCSRVDFSQRFWTWGRGGHPLADDEWSISFTDTDMVETRYKLPRCIVEIMQMMQEQGRREVQGQIRTALGI